MTSKPAIIFRIACRNEKGYGPATQVKWLQGEPIIYFKCFKYSNFLGFSDPSTNKIMAASSGPAVKRTLVTQQQQQQQKRFRPQ